MNVEGESAQLERVLINMCLNARESIHTGGKVTVTTENVEIGKGTQENRLGLEPGKYVRIDLKDTGIGMSEEAVRNCFDPFFSTKGLGYGLGLSSAHGIVSAHGGQIIVHSRPGKGTVMSVYLPGISKAGAASGKSAGKEMHRTILVADDEELIRKMVSDGLGSMGYRRPHGARRRRGGTRAEGRGGGDRHRAHRHHHAGEGIQRAVRGDEGNAAVTSR